MGSERAPFSPTRSCSVSFHDASTSVRTNTSNSPEYPLMDDAALLSLSQCFQDTSADRLTR